MEKERKPGDKFISRAYCKDWYSCQGKNGIVHHSLIKEEIDELSEKYKKGLVAHGLMEI